MCVCVLCVCVRARIHVCVLTQRLGGTGTMQAD